MEVLQFQGPAEARVKEVRVKTGGLLTRGKLVMVYQGGELEGRQGEVGRVKSTDVGRVLQILVKVGDPLQPGQAVLQFQPGCAHPTVMKDMCAECGADLRMLEQEQEAGVAMVHAIPELKVSVSEAASLGRQDLTRLVAARKLVLLVEIGRAHV